MKLYDCRMTKMIVLFSSGLMFIVLHCAI